MDMKKDLEVFEEAKKAKIEGLPTLEDFKKMKSEEAKAFAEFQKATK